MHRPNASCRRDKTAGPRRAPVVEALEGRQLLAASLLLDAVPGPEGSRPTLLGVHDGRVVFATRIGTSTGVWLSDGTSAGTTLAGTVPTVIRDYGAIVHQGRAYFLVVDPYAFQAKPVGWINLTTGAVGGLSGSFPNSYYPNKLLVRDGQVHYVKFYRQDGYFDYGIFNLNNEMVQGHEGESEGFTVRARGLRVGNLQPGDGRVVLYQAWQGPLTVRSPVLKEAVPSQQLFDLGGLALLAGDGTEVWTTDGTRPGTRPLAQVEELATIAPGARIAMLAYVNGKLLYAHTDAEHGTEVWSQDVQVNLPQFDTPAAPVLAPGMDTGISATDGITRIERPTFLGSAAPGSLVTLFANGAPVGTAVAGDAGRYELTPQTVLQTEPGVQPPIDGWGRVRVRVNATDAQGVVSHGSPPLDLQIDPRAPSAHTFRFRTDEVSFRYSDAHVIEPSSVNATNLSLVNLTTGQVVAAEEMSLALTSAPLPRPVLRVAVTFPGLPGGTLPAGQWRFTLAAGAGVDLAGNALSAPVVQEFTIAPQAAPLAPGSTTTSRTELFPSRADPDPRDDLLA